MKKLYEKPELEFINLEIVETLTDNEGGIGGVGGSSGFEDEDDW